ncbi:HTH domain-containing protein [Anaerovibrio slackiae]|jgi:DeoR/GlpR family transcriptional regulator of sugar metabolism|uniref:HTH domain-containing protein n=1 Tax=Anaerovibrio slackiae TaxID=2652309 RepID=UPI00386CF8DC
MAAAERREAILEALYQRREDKMTNLAHEFGVTRQTIKNDIDVLSLTHPEIEVRTGRYGGGVFIKPGFRSDRKYLKPAEQELLEKLSHQLTGTDLATMQGLLNRLTL